MGQSDKTHFTEGPEVPKPFSKRLTAVYLQPVCIMTKFQCGGKHQNKTNVSNQITANEDAT